MEDDLFQSLGGSLMKDLLADLQGDDDGGDGWLSLEQLEKELSQLDDNSDPPAAAPTSLPLPTAASMVVTGQQQQQSQQQQPIQGVGLLGAVTVTKQAPADAWKESLQKFTALSLDQDFLAADTVRKQQTNYNSAAPQLPPGFMAEAEDYDASEKVTIKPPPGMMSAPGIQAADEEKEREEKAKLAAATLLPGAAVPSMPKPKALPKTPANSVTVGAGGQGNNNSQKARAAARMPKTPRNSVIISSAEEAGGVSPKKERGDDDIPMMGKVSILKKEGGQQQPKLPTKTPRNSVVVPSQDAAAAAVVAASAAAQGMAMPPPQHQGMPPFGMPGMPPHGMPPHMMQGMPPPHPGMHMQGMPPPQGMMPMQQGHPNMPPPQMMGGAVAMAMPTGGPAWQTGPRPPPPPPPMRVFCNPHPNAPPIPAQVLESRMMKQRDITYIVHSILRPVLMAGFSEHDYDIQLLHRQSGGRPAGPRPLMMRRGKQQQQGNKNGDNEDPATMDAVEQEMASREKKAKEWMTKKSALGHIPKANVARPRALIASPAIAQANQEKSEHASEQKQRARLWKARIYCDQAYQAYLAVVDIWAKATPGSVPKEVHAPLIRLMKCLGIAPVSSSASGESVTAAGGGGDFQVDASVLELFLKLSKGRILFARIVEQALLPPSAVQAVLPATLDILYKTPSPGAQNKQRGASASAYGGDLTDDRCFRALTVVVQTLPALSGESILKSAGMMKTHSEAALSSTSRMECLHALLQRGTGLAGSNDPALGDYPAKWKEQEDNFMAILSGM